MHAEGWTETVAVTHDGEVREARVWGAKDGWGGRGERVEAKS